MLFRSFKPKIISTNTLIVVAVVVINVADDDGNEGDNLQENIFHDNYILLFGKPLKVPRFLTRSVLQ